DETVEILHSYQDPRFKWLSEADSGQAGAINKGLLRAQGGIVTYLNSDDLLLPNAISMIVSIFEKYPDTDAVYGDVILIDATGKDLGAWQSKTFDIAVAIQGEQYVLQPGLCWRRLVMERIGLFDETLHFVMDQDYWLRMALAGFQLKYIPGNRAQFR